jgi:hypothetical protein
MPTAKSGFKVSKDSTFVVASCVFNRFALYGSYIAFGVIKALMNNMAFCLLPVE